jgi:hypothetical protein
MKSCTFGILFFALTLVPTAKSWAQSLVATTVCSTATANHNQRKIARDSNQDLWVVYEDSASDSGHRIQLMHYSRTAGTWSQPEFRFYGTAPTVAIGRDNRMFFVFEGEGSSPGDQHICLCVRDPNPEQWSKIRSLSGAYNHCRLPSADVDSAGTLHVVWIEDSASLAYVSITGDSVSEKQTLSGKGERVYDAVIANNLGYRDCAMLCAYGFVDSRGDSMINMLYRKPVANQWMPFDSTIRGAYGRPGFPLEGSWPCLAVGVMDTTEFGGPHAIGSAPVLINRDSQGGAVIRYFENIYPYYHRSPDIFDGFWGPIPPIPGPISSILIDNPIYPVGFSYVYLYSGKMYHRYHSFFSNYCNDCDTVNNVIDGEPFNPTMTYKHFNPEYIDVVWMQKLPDSGYGLMYQQMEKGFLLRKESEVAVGSKNTLSTTRAMASAGHGAIIAVFDLTGRKIAADVSTPRGRSISGVKIFQSGGTLKMNILRNR